jgi:hypothetical protein
MPETPAKAAPAKATQAPARKEVPESADLAPEEVSDERDTSPRLRNDTTGKRVRAIPAHGYATVVKLSRKDFAAHDVDHGPVEFSFRKNEFTLPVGKRGLSQEAADLLTGEFPMQFEYVNDGSDSSEEK